jgi:predicted membrane channel-forming protein YqfA (hemolysin III family)
MEALTNLLESLAWPEYPSTPGAQAAFIATAISILLGLAITVFPTSIGHFLGLESRQARPGAIGELRAAGGFLLGLALITLLFDQPVLYTLLGAALLLAAFGRLLSLMSDRAATFRNILILLAQAILAIAALAHFFDVFPELVTPQFTLPETFDVKLVLYVYLGLAVIGAFMMFAPRLTGWCVGLTGATDSGYSAVRSAGGFLLAAGIFGALFIGSPEARDTPFDKLLYVNMGFCAAFSISILGRLISLVLNRGNYIYAIAALVVETAACAAAMSYVGSLM